MSQDARKMMKRDWERRAQELSLRFIDDRAHNEEELKALGEADAEMILSDISQYLTPEARLLEIGCGIGRLMGPMARRFSEVWGVDISPEMIRRGRERLAAFSNVRFVENSGTDLQGVPGDYFDLCYSYFAFRHLTEHWMTESYIREAHRVLKQGGILKVEVSGIYATNPFRSLYEEGRADSWQGVRFCMSEIVRLVETVGFQMMAAYHPREKQQMLASSQLCEDVERQRRLWVVARKDSGMDQWEKVCYASGQALARVVPPGSVVLLPEFEMEEHLVVAGAAHVHFSYLESPADSAGAIALLEKQRQSGGQYLLLSRYGLWWLEVYEEFAAYLNSHYRVAQQGEDYVIYDLR
jgi:ubiquinone/menaquinone biosynthesis C-methylase UbiE